MSVIGEAQIKREGLIKHPCTLSSFHSWLNWSEKRSRWRWNWLSWGNKTEQKWQIKVPAQILRIDVDTEMIKVPLLYTHNQPTV